LKILFTLLLPIVTGLVATGAPKVPECFKVHSLIRMDEDHYWANWTNACPYTIDSVYIMVKFAGPSREGLGDGVWALHFVTPGTHQVTRFTSPRNIPDFDSVYVSKITTDWAEALHLEAAPEDQPRTVEALTITAKLSADPRPAAQPIPTLNALLESPAPVLLPAPLPAPPPHADSLSASEHHRRGRELLNQGKFHEAIEELSEAIRERSDFALAYNARGFAYHLLREYKRALADLDEAIRLNPQYLNAYQNRSSSRKAAGDRAGSSEDANKVRALVRVTTD
jgi:tetratricopeptide (TPR) repeat protein